MPRVITKPVEETGTPNVTLLGSAGVSQKVKASKAKWIFFLVLVLAVVVAGVYFLKSRVGVETSRGSGWQAVFLTNNQVYFGHVVREDAASIVLHEIYYFQAANKGLQSSEEGEQGANQFSLVKLGNELHGPKDEMRIVRNNVLFVEDLKAESKVVEAIERYIVEQQE